MSYKPNSGVTPIFIPSNAAGTNLWNVQAGTWGASGADGLGFLGNTLTNSSADALNDMIRKNLVVPVTGVWKARICANTGTNSGVWSVLVDSASKGTWDQYSGSSVYNQWSSEISLGALTAGTVYTLDLKVTDKNASSGGHETYFIGILLYL